jgi:hypothetical protein
MLPAQKIIYKRYNMRILMTTIEFFYKLLRYSCVGDTHIGAASSVEADLHIKSFTGPPTSRDPHPSSLPLEAYSNTTSSILRTV